MSESDLFKCPTFPINPNNPKVTKCQVRLLVVTQYFPHFYSLVLYLYLLVYWYSWYILKLKFNILRLALRLGLTEPGIRRTIIIDGAIILLLLIQLITQ